MSTDAIIEELRDELPQALLKILDGGAVSASDLNVVRQYLLDNRAHAQHDDMLKKLAIKLRDLIQAGAVSASFLNVVRQFLNDAAALEEFKPSTPGSVITEILPFADPEDGLSVH